MLPQIRIPRGNVPENGEWAINMEFNYEYGNQIYKITAEKIQDAHAITFDDTIYTIHASEIKPGYLKISLGDTLIKAVISEGKDRKFVFLDGQVYAIRRALPKAKRIEQKQIS